MMRPERVDVTPRTGTRSYSFSSETPSMPGHGLLSPPTSVNPEPAYIAVSAASQLVSSELETDGVTISASALAQLNGFLDNILFNILLAAKSTKLSLLRPAIFNVLKPKLGRAALSNADEELKEYMGDDEAEEDDDDPEIPLDQEIKRDFDLELAWKLARLRCMVYSRLGDLEEDDEDEYMAQENLDERGGRPRRFSSHPSRVTTASAIFLTSVVEFLAEQALAYAAQATQRKLSKSYASQGTLDSIKSQFTASDRIVVSDADMRYLGRDSPLQKLWRGWRHQIRVPVDSLSRPISPDLLMVAENSRQAGLHASTNVAESEYGGRPPFAGILHDAEPASVPLPLSANGIDGNDVTGLNSDTDHNNTKGSDFIETLRNGRSGRPSSWQHLPSGLISSMPALSQDRTGSIASATSRPRMRHRRSQSLPTSSVLKLPTMSGSIATKDSRAVDSPMMGGQMEAGNAGQDLRQGTLQQPSTTSHSTQGEGEGTWSPSATAMPGSFPRVDTVYLTEIAKVNNASLPRPYDALSKAPDLISAGPTLNAAEHQPLLHS